ncbi:hypothetical protein [Streptomyces triticirhizae]|uniref:hypothetical protein n=1 Tax=Streptomyces triticirhizae TaxID=2483353 RepID=UPI0011C40FD4|nr:hypothetical protein [Streptomyces triticirhizae]
MAMLTDCDDVVTVLGLTPALYRQLLCVHEAGHVIAADGLGVPVLGARLTLNDPEDKRLGYVELGPQPLADGSRLALLGRLIVRAAGAQAAYLWLERRGTTADLAALRQDPDLFGADDDCTEAAEACAAQPEYGLTPQAGVVPAAQLLLARWPAVLRVAYWLGRRERLDGQQLRALLTDADRAAWPGASRAVVGS